MPHTPSSDRLAPLSLGDISAVIQMAWEDRTAYETIRERFGISESDVIKIMRTELKKLRPPRQARIKTTV